MEEKKDILKDIFVNKNIYEFFELKIASKEKNKWVLSKNDFLYFQNLLRDSNRTIIKCLNCDMNLSFNVYCKMFTFDKGIKKDFSVLVLGALEYQNPTTGGSATKKESFTNFSEYLKNLSTFYDKTFYVQYHFVCQHDENHCYIMTLRFDLKNGIVKIGKIGQDPLNTMLLESKANYYSKQLNIINSLEDYKSANQCTSRSLYAGACTYLRRILEKMINFYCEKDGKPNLTDNHIETKIKIVKKYFDDDVKDLLKNLYALLSKGIHELDESEIKKFYYLLNQIIDLQLEYEKTKNDAEIRKKSLKKELDSLVTKY